MTTGEQQTRRRGIAFAQLLVVLLACMQVAVAAHQFEHSAADVDDTCVVCIQLDRNGDAAPPAVAVPDAVTPPSLAVRQGTAPYVVRFAAPYQARASP